MSILEVRDLSLELGGRLILNHLNLAIAEGTIQLIIGPNGAGKSSLLKSILGLNRYQGQIVIGGLENEKINAAQRARFVAYVPQSLELQFNLDVRSFLNLSRYAFDGESPSERYAIIEEVLEQTETAHLTEAFLDELSGGERQRVLIAAALVQRPRLLLLDEPTTAMDPGHRRDLVQLLARLHKQEKMTLLLVTHDWNEYLHLNPSILALKDGEVSFTCGAHGLKEYLDDLFGCGFLHVKCEDHWLSVPRWS